MLARLNVGSSSLPTPRAPEERSASAAPILGVTDEPQCGLPRGGTPADRPPAAGEVEWQGDLGADTGAYCSLGRGLPRMGRWLGSGVRPATAWWPLVSSRTEVAYRRPGIIGTQPGGVDFCEELPRQPCLDPHGQPGGSELREQDRRSPHCSSASACAGSLDTVPGSQHHSLCKVPVREPERRSGFLVTESQFSGVGAAPSSMRSDPVTLSPYRGAFVRHPPQHADSTLRQLAARALIRRYRRFHSRLGRGRRLRVPPFALLARCLQWVGRQRVPSLVLVTPLWRGGGGAPWFPPLLDGVVEAPFRLPQ